MNEQPQQAYFQFLMELLQATTDSNGNAQVIYPLLANNTDKLDVMLAEILRQWGTNRLREAKADEAKSIARNIFLLSNLIQQFPLGNKASNVEFAITGYELALTVYTQQAFPVDWAAIQNNLAGAYRNRIKGERAENLEMAIVTCQEALKIRTFEAFPIDWAMTQNSLGSAYSYRIRGERAENLETAINCFQEALKVYSFDAFPYEWAATQNSLAHAYSERIKGERAENLETAINCFQEALKIRTFEAFPIDWAMTQNSLGSAYSYRIRGERAENLETAINCFQEALKFYTFEAFPYQWAMTQNNLANAYSDRIRGERAENLETAINCFQEALKVYTFEAFPSEWAMAQNNLASTYIYRIKGERAENLEVAIAFYREAFKVYTFEAFPYQWAMTQNNLAIVYYERIRGERAENLEKAIAAYQETLKVYTFEDFPYEWARTQNNLASAYIDRIKEERAENLEMAFAACQEALKNKILAFIVIYTGEVTVWQSQLEDREALENWLNQYLQNYGKQKDEWRNSLGEELKKLASILHIDEILTKIPNHCNKLILIPHRFLHLFPLHALPVTSQKYQKSSCLLDLFAGGVSYAPSCQLLQQVQKRQRPDFQSLVAIQNPTEDLAYTNLEVQVIQSHFKTANVLKKTAATLTAINNSDLNNYHCAHFSCHGYFNLTNPGKSALILANAPIADTPTKPDSERYLNLRAGETHDLEKCLTLDKIFTLKLEKCRLVTLSACETGLIDFNNTSDEYIGLPSGFLLAGSKAVVSSLWRVDELSTAFLMMKFYENLQTINSVSLALYQAQQWLRNLTTEEFEALLIKYQRQIEEIFAQISEDWRPVARAILRRTCKRKPHPFAAPFYWAGFTATGL
ncbi:MAG: tetratricopeptide repeat protein [Chlorogloeopsis fritschii C42_A2020_084]|uniref:CHAT domain-containing protein n=1 Tax=Chlorogloeopsis fritschii TaxID=1124 RepID=UPI001A073D83|nr:CHAT domain-containing protein [Chlorogloeopsis fritschii]MBF2008912.1 tetratricopeptide repeat protein [Chlorogloeopsis fritschii C42_A2020_084]